MVIEAAELHWLNGIPYSVHFAEPYFSLDDGLARIEPVFLHAHQLAARFSTLESHTSFTIAEIGFGTGLNFLTTWQLWQQTRPDDAWLHFVSIEKYPLKPDDLAQVLALWPNLQALAEQLLAHYPPLTAGWHRLFFPEQKLTLTLLFGDANELLPDLVAEVDAWFLDGFAPDKNPDLWHIELLRHVAKLSQTSTTLSCAHVDVAVKQTLTDVGFLLSDEFAIISATMQHPPAKTRSWQSRSQHQTNHKTAIVIGAGIAGVSCARALALRGWQVTVIEQAPHCASAASGNPAAIIYPKLAPAHLSAWHFQQQAYLSLLPQLRDTKLADIWQERGLLWLLAGNQQREGAKLDNHPWPSSLVRKVEADEASAIAGVAINLSLIHI